MAESRRAAARQRAQIRAGHRTLIASLTGFAVLAAALIGYVELVAHPAAAPAAIVDRFELVDQDGAAVSDATYRGKWLLIYFGYTHCPDACPTALNDIAEALDGLGAKRQAIQPLFVTVDPERDTAPVLKGYTAAFQAGIVGLTGSPNQIAQAAKSFHVFYERDKGSDRDYAMSHSSVIYLIGPDGRFVTFFTGEATPEAIHAALIRFVS
jgi:protein SCO1/2